jgi:hypothetical protein
MMHPDQGRDLGEHRTGTVLKVNPDLKEEKNGGVILRIVES